MRLFLCKLLCFFRRKYYTHILSLGYNCEVSFQFFKNYRFVESSLFAWTGGGCAQLIGALEDLDRIGSRQLVLLKYKMFLDEATGIAFHPKDDKITEENEAEYRTELLGRLAYLKKKFTDVGRDGKSKLYVYKYPPEETSAAVIEEQVGRINAALHRIIADPFDLLLVLQKDAPLVRFKEPNLHVRRVRRFAPASSVTEGPYDRWGWCRIFAEFRPGVILKHTKRFKFEARD